MLCIVLQFVITGSFAVTPVKKGTIIEFSAKIIGCQAVSFRFTKRWHSENLVVQILIRLWFFGDSFLAPPAQHPCNYNQKEQHSPSNNTIRPVSFIG
jgi:hypothetical protein